MFGIGFFFSFSFFLKNIFDLQEFPFCGILRAEECFVVCCSVVHVAPAVTSF